MRHRSDGNRQGIVDALRAVGCVVRDIGTPVDLLVAVPRIFLAGSFGPPPHWLPMEIKRPPGPRGGMKDRGHTDDQKVFIMECDKLGLRVCTVDSPEAALRAIGVMK